MTRFVIVRHGESTWNVEGRWQGQADTTLSDLGKRQAFVAAGHVGTVDAIYASDLRRASHTAEIIGESLGIGPIRRDSRLRERHAGPWEGLTRDEIEARFPGWLAAHRRPDGFEDDEQLLARVDSALAEISEEHGDTDLLVVSHGGIVRALERSHGLERGFIPNLGGIVLTRTDSEVHVGERVVLIDPDEIEVTIPGQI